MYKRQVLLSNEVEILKIRAEFQNQVKARIDKNQKEYILREQLKLIREELGEDNVQSEIESFKEKAEKLRAVSYTHLSGMLSGL